MWTLRGVRPTIPAAGTNQKLCLYGSFNYRTGQVHYLIHPRKNAERFKQFLDQLLFRHRARQVILVLDNATYHRTREILDVLAEHEDHVRVVWLTQVAGRTLDGLFENVEILFGRFDGPATSWFVGQAG